jgi:hypothetical protein
MRRVPQRSPAPLAWLRDPRDDGERGHHPAPVARRIAHVDDVGERDAAGDDQRGEMERAGERVAAAHRDEREPAAAREREPERERPRAARLDQLHRLLGRVDGRARTGARLDGRRVLRRLARHFALSYICTCCSRAKR